MEIRFYFTDADAHIIGPAIEAECADDARAMAKAAELGRTPAGGAKHVEAWEGARFVGKVPVEL